MSVDDALLNTGAGYAGYVMGGVLMAGIVPAIFAFYGKQNGKSWALSLGWILALLFTAGGLYSGSRLGAVLGFALFLAVVRGVKEKPRE